VTTASHRQIALAFLAIATAFFIVRGPVRTLRSGDDLAPPYGGARAWLLGENPYLDASLSEVLLKAGRETDEHGKPVFNPSLYPPPTFVALAPFAALPWPAARFAFLLVSLALFVWHLRSLFRLADLSWNDVTGVWLLGAVLALAPYHTGIALAQVAIPCVALLVVAIDRIHRGHAFSGGMLLALATLFKPQIAAPFILYFLLRRHQRAALIALGACVIATAIGIGWLTVNDVPWLESWKTATAGILVPGGHHDPSGPWSAQLLELRPLITALTGIEASGMIGFGIAAVLGVAVFLMGRQLSEQHDLLLLSVVAVLTLFATYHRFYDAVLLCLAVAWAASVLRDQPSLTRHALVAGGCCAVFFVPGAWMLQRWANEGRVSAEWTQSFAWNAVVLRHQNWALVGLCLTLMSAIGVSRGGGRDANV
jgi:hypothetical protein